MLGVGQDKISDFDGYLNAYLWLIPQTQMILLHFLKLKLVYCSDQQAA